MLKTHVVTKESLGFVVSALSLEKEKGFDTETSGLGYKDLPFALTVATNTDVYYFELKDFKDNYSQLIAMFSDGRFFSHNAKFDFMMLTKLFGRVFNIDIHCTMITDRLLRNDLFDYSLAETARRYGFDKDMRVDAYIKEHDLYEQKWFMGEKVDRVPLYASVPRPLLIEYACQDAWLHLQIGLKQNEKLRKSLH